MSIPLKATDTKNNEFCVVKHNRSTSNPNNKSKEKLDTIDNQDYLVTFDFCKGFTLGFTLL